MLLKIGSTGPQVEQVQRLVGAARITGDFDQATKTLVKKWQGNHGLAADGLVGPSTWVEMFPPTTSLECTALHSKLIKVVPATVVAQIEANASVFVGKTELQMAHFLAQCSEESMGFTKVSENLNYSEMSLAKIFDRHFTDAEIAHYAHQPEKIANRVYANRMGNGDEASGDGWLYRGRGNIQMTGKSMYALFSKFIGEDCVANPDLVATKYPLISAVFYFTYRKIWVVCNKGSSPVVVKEVTKKINPALLGLDKRVKLFNKFHTCLS